MEAESAKLEREIGLLKAKEQESCQDLGKSTSTFRKNKAQPLEKQKSLEIPAKLMGDEELCLNQSQGNESATPAAQSIAAVKINTGVENRNYVLVVASKPAKIREKPWT